MSKKVFSDPIKIASLWQRFLLFFVKSQKYIDRFEMPNTVILFKKMFGVIYIVKVYSIPPEHFNCRCAFVERT